MRPLRFFERLLVLVPLAFAPTACVDEHPIPLTSEVVTQRMLEGKRHLSRFEGEAARNIFRELDDAWRAEHAEPHCEASWGIALADVQVALAILNPPLLEWVSAQVRPLEDPGDQGAALEAMWTAVDPTLADLAAAAKVVTELPDCAFAIGLDAAEAPEEDLRYVLFALDNSAPVAEVTLRARFDGVEARLLLALTEAIRGISHLGLAHDLRWTLDAAKTAHQLGVRESCLDAGFFPCLLAGPDANHADRNLLDWAFVLEDNARLLAKSTDRWETHANEIAPALLAAASPLLTLFPTLSERTERWEPEWHGQFVIAYRDRNENGTIDAGDQLGLRIDEFRLRCDALIGTAVPAAEAEACDSLFDNLEVAVGAGLLFLGSAAAPGEAVIAEFQTFFERLADAFTAVGDPAHAYERIPFTSFSGLFTDLFPVLDVPAPEFMAFDVPAFFTDPQPLRTFFPAWEKTAGPTGARFLADADDYSTVVTPPATMNGVDGWLDEAAGGWVYGLFGESAELPFDPFSATDRALFGCPGGAWCVPADCLHAGNLYSELAGFTLDWSSRTYVFWPVIYMAFADPSFHGLVHVDMDVWADRYDPQTGNGAAPTTACPGPSGLQPADAGTLHRSAWLFADFFTDHFQLGGMVAQILRGF